MTQPFATDETPAPASPAPRCRIAPQMMPSSLFLAGVSVQMIRDSPAAFTTGCCIIVASRSSCCLCSCGYHDKLCLWDFNLQEASRLSMHGMLFTICADLHIFSIVLLAAHQPDNQVVSCCFYGSLKAPPPVMDGKCLCDRYEVATALSTTKRSNCHHQEINITIHEKGFIKEAIR